MVSTFFWQQKKVEKENCPPDEKMGINFHSLAKIYRLEASRDKFFNARSAQFLTFFRNGGFILKTFQHTKFPLNSSE